MTGVLKTVPRKTLAEQTAAHLREGIRNGRWAGKMPGINVLAAECDVSRETMRAAIGLLEKEKWIRFQGAGRARMAAAPATGRARVRRSLRVMVLLGKRLEDEDGDFQQVLAAMQHGLEAAGHVCRFAPKSQAALHRDLRRIKLQVAEHPADAWIVVGGNRETLTWFSQLPVPVLALGGHFIGLPMAGTGMDDTSGFRVAIRRLIELGHRRIVFLWPGARATQPVGLPVAIFTEELLACGVKVDNFHVPEFEDTPQGLRALLEKLFVLTPPTAILCSHTNWMSGVLSFLAGRGLQAPRDISLISLGVEAWLTWKQPEMARLQGDGMLMVKRIVHWAKDLAAGRVGRTYLFVPEEFIEGGTIGPVKG